jgi:hypothetical protein
MRKLIFLDICIWPFAPTLSGTCVNVLIDQNNCGMVGYECNANYTSCSDGICSMAPAVQQTNRKIIWDGATNGSIDYRAINVTLPLNITLYNTTTNIVTVAANGVSLLP